MKRLISFIAFALVLFAFGASLASAQQLPDRFPTKEGCLAALASNQYTAYIPSHLKGHKPLTKGETKRPLEANACVLLDIVGPRDMWVVQLMTVEYVFGPDGVIRRRWDCGNGAKAIAYLAVVEDAPVAEPTPRVEMRQIAIDPGPEPEPVDLCPNISGPQETVPAGMVMDPNGNCVVPATAYRPEPEAPRRVSHEDDGPIITIGAEYVFGKMISEYTDPIPDRGDVPQRHSFRDLIGYVRFDQSERQGFFAYGEMSLVGSTGEMEFQDARGDWNDKNRDADESKNDLLQVRAGYKFPVGDTLSVGPYVGYTKLCLPCEQYEAQGATTTTEREFAGLVLGAELAIKAGDRVMVTGLGEYGPSLNRKSWTEQVYGEIDFPRVDHPDEKAKSLRLRLGVDGKISGPFYATAAYEHLRITSQRPENYAAKEYTTTNALSVGVAFKWGR